MSVAQHRRLYEYTKEYYGDICWSLKYNIFVLLLSNIK